jgi:hypothetical protein
MKAPNSGLKNEEVPATISSLLRRGILQNVTRNQEGKLLGISAGLSAPQLEQRSDLFFLSSSGFEATK